MIGRADPGDRLGHHFFTPIKLHLNCRFRHGNIRKSAVVDQIIKFCGARGFEFVAARITRERIAGHRNTQQRQRQIEPRAIPFFDGAVGAGIASLLTPAFQQMIENDIQGFKRYIETGVRPA